jgi:uncharacterized membrane protein (DUF373 family)
MKHSVPAQLQIVQRLTVAAMFWLNGAAHLIIGLALATSVIMFTWLFILDVRQGLEAHDLVHGFVHALGTLMLLWTISALITAEIRYLEGERLEVDTFIEVALVVILRKVITLPVLSVQPPIEEVLLWNAGALILGILFFFVRRALKTDPPISSPPSVL